MSLEEQQLQMLRRMATLDPPHGMRLPADLFDQPPARLDDIRIRVAAPLALYHMREGIAAQGSFGEPSERQRESAGALREELLLGMTDAELEPTVERLTIDPG
jgi:hypothetical protein